jgi:predicted xylose isomerase-like sugar epimerase
LAGEVDAELLQRRVRHALRLCLVELETLRRLLDVQSLHGMIGLLGFRKPSLNQSDARACENSRTRRRTAERHHGGPT